MITGDTIQQAENELRRASEFDGMVGVHRRANVNSDHLAHFIKACRDLVAGMPPECIPALDTVLGHAFMVGVMCGRQEPNSGTPGIINPAELGDNTL